jgi:hypothetical protein
VNKKQKTVLLVCAVFIIIMGLIPPWYYQGVYSYEQRIPKTMQAQYDYGFIFYPPPIYPVQAHSAYIPRIAFDRLIVQWILVVVAGVALFILKENKRE